MTLIKSVEKAVDILSCFTVESPYLTVIEIARRTGFNKSTVSRILTTLAVKNCVEHVDSSGKYCLGTKFYQWGSLLKPRKSLVDLARPKMEKLRDACGEEVSLYVINDRYRTCIEVVPSVYGLASVTPVGMMLPLHCGAAGKILLAHLSESKRKEILYRKDLEKFTPSTMTDPKAIEKDLEKIRVNGYATTRGEWEEWSFSVAAPIVNGQGKVIASLAVGGLIFRFSDEKYQKMLECVLKTVQEISTDLKSMPTENKK